MSGIAVDPRGLSNSIFGGLPSGLDIKSRMQW